MGSVAKRVNSGFFDTWTEQSAYVLGFIYADGSLIDSDGPSDHLRFCNNDQDVLLQIRSAMESESSVLGYEYNGGKRNYYLTITNKRLTDRLREIGLEPRKSKTKTFPDMPGEMLCHFIRGYFDGNGHFTYEKHKGESRRLVSGFTCGSENFIFSLSQALESLGLKMANIAFVNRKERGTGYGSYYQIRYYARDSKKLFQLMYRDASIFMKRKKEAALSVINPQE